MSNQYDNTNRGAIWNNTRQRPGKTDPHFTGTINVEGQEYWISAWKRREGAPDTAPVLSLSVRKVEPKQEESYQSPAQSVPDDEIPW